MKSCITDRSFLNFFHDTKNVYSFSNVAKKINIDLEQDEIISDIFGKYQLLVVLTNIKTIMYNESNDLHKIIYKKSACIEFLHGCIFLLGIDGIVDIYDNYLNYKLSIMDKNVCSISSIGDILHLTVKMDNNKFQYFYCKCTCYFDINSNKVYNYKLYKSFDETTYDSKYYYLYGITYGAQIYNNTCIKYNYPHDIIKYNYSHDMREQLIIDLQYEISHIIVLDCVVCVVNSKNMIKYYLFRADLNRRISPTVIDCSDNEIIKNVSGLRTKKAQK